LRLVTILLAYSVPGWAVGSLVGAAAAVLAFPVAGAQDEHQGKKQR
jgi:hypothetical protein